MLNPAIPAIALYALLAFVLAVFLVVIGGGSVMGVGAEGLSRACSNLALIGIAVGVWHRRG